MVTESSLGADKAIDKGERLKWLAQIIVLPDSEYRKVFRSPRSKRFNQGLTFNANVLVPLINTALTQQTKQPRTDYLTALGKYVYLQGTI